jgi:hypothetical protein
MSVATLSLLSRDSLELHFEGACYGPISHTQALGTLLFALRPTQVDLAARGPAFEKAMKQVLAAAEGTAAVLETWAAHDDVEGLPEVSPDTLAVWIHACCKSAPADEALALQSKLTIRLGKNPWASRTLH